MSKRASSSNSGEHAKKRNKKPSYYRHIKSALIAAASGEEHKLLNDDVQCYLDFVHVLTKNNPAWEVGAVERVAEECFGKALMDKNVPLIRSLVSFGLDCDGMVPVSGSWLRPLHVAMRYKIRKSIFWVGHSQTQYKANKEVIRLLVKHGASPYGEDEYRRTPFDTLTDERTKLLFAGFVVHGLLDRIALREEYLSELESCFINIGRWESENTELIMEYAWTLPAYDYSTFIPLKLWTSPCNMTSNWRMRGITLPETALHLFQALHNLSNDEKYMDSFKTVVRVSENSDEELEGVGLLSYFIDTGSITGEFKNIIESEIQVRRKSYEEFLVSGGLETTYGEWAQDNYESRDRVY